MDSGRELVQDMIRRMIVYFETPKEKRRENAAKEDWRIRWFGVVPFSVQLWRRQALEQIREHNRKRVKKKQETPPLS